MKFQIGRLYRHFSCLDIDFEVRGILGENETLISFVISYWNRKLKIYQGGRMQAVSIRKDEFWKWKKVDKDDNTGEIR
jgi:hypothetical protein